MEIDLFERGQHGGDADDAAHVLRHRARLVQLVGLLRQLGQEIHARLRPQSSKSTIDTIDEIEGFEELHKSDQRDLARRVDDWAAGSYSSSDAASPSDAASAPPSAGSAPPSAASAPPSAGYASSFFERSESRRGGSESRRSGSESDARRSHPDRNDGSPVGRMFRDEIVDLEGDLAALAGKLTSLGERLGCVSRVVAAEAP